MTFNGEVDAFIAKLSPDGSRLVYSTESGGDRLRGGAGGDVLAGGVGNDQLFGETGSDAL